jgi:NAD(P)-dependent dehydrogenase (short-subunit alcohol dehydrogenase family)
MDQLQHKVAVITGGNSGIGFATAQEFLAKGAKVIITGRKKAAVEEAVAALGAGADGFVADQGKLQDADALARHIEAKYGAIDILFVNAGIAYFSAFAEVSESQFDEIMDINFKGAFFTAQKLLPLLKDGGALIFLSSVNAYAGMPGTAVYGASKAAMNSLTRTLARELASRNIRVNVVNPGPIKTAIFGKTGRSEAEVDVMLEQIKGAVPLQRVGESAEVAKLVAFLASDDSKFITGAELNIDGGIAVHPLIAL